jgi:hypothetical protein
MNGLRSWQVGAYRLQIPSGVRLAGRLCQARVADQIVPRLAEALRQIGPFSVPRWLSTALMRCAVVSSRRLRLRSRTTSCDTFCRDYSGLRGAPMFPDGLGRASVVSCLLSTMSGAALLS